MHGDIMLVDANSSYEAILGTHSYAWGLSCLKVIKYNVNHRTSLRLAAKATA